MTDPTTPPAVTLHEFLTNLVYRLKLVRHGIPFEPDDRVDAETGDTWATTAEKFARAVPPDSHVEAVTGADLSVHPAGEDHVGLVLKGRGFHAETIVSRAELARVLHGLLPGGPDQGSQGPATYLQKGRGGGEVLTDLDRIEAEEDQR